MQLDNFFHNKYTAGLQGYLDLFVKKKIGFYSETNENFINVPHEYISPFKATNAIVEVENTINYCISTLIESLINIGCHEIEIRIENYNTLVAMLDILENFRTSIVRSFYLIYQCKNQNENLNLEHKISRNLKINQLKIFGCKDNYKGQKNRMIYIQQTYKEEKGLTTLIINPIYFFESQKNNASLNQKIVVDKKGNIKNYINHKDSFGNVNNKEVETILSDKDFIKIWNIPNDIIETCKECHFRYFCLNFSEIVKKKGKYFKKNYCKSLFLN